MATYRRETVPGATWFFTVATYRRQRVLTLAPVLAALREGLRHVRRAHPLQLRAMVVLPDHLHTIWTLPPGDADIAIRWALLKRHVSRKVRALLPLPQSASLRRRSELGLWQRRFWEHRIRDERDLRHHLNYVHANPVKHGLVSRVADWPYSTFHRYVREGILPRDWAGTSIPPSTSGEP